MKRTYEVIELEYMNEEYEAEITHDDKNMYRLFLSKKGYGDRHFIIGGADDGRGNDAMIEMLIDYLYIEWDNGENCFDGLNKDIEIIENYYNNDDLYLLELTENAFKVLEDKEYYKSYTWQSDGSQVYENSHDCIMDILNEISNVLNERMA